MDYARNVQLEHIARKHTPLDSKVMHAKVALLASEGLSIKEIRERLHLPHGKL
jgi:hypothetical protein